MKAETLVAEIARVTGWRGNVKALPDWASVEGELGTPLPTDYKGLLSRFPSGTYRGAIWVRSPTLDGYTQDIRERLAILADEDLEYLEGTSYQLFPVPGGLLPWGDDGQGGLFCWLTRSADPDQWSVAYYSRTRDDWREHPGPMVRLLLDFLTAQGRNNIVGWNLDGKPAEFRVHSIMQTDGTWKPVE